MDTSLRGQQRRDSAAMVPLGVYLTQRLYDAGVKDIFGVPGDFSLGLFNHFVNGPTKYIGCCNELNAAYAADGYARINGIGAVATTYAVGELSAVNGIAGAWAENVPVVKITGAPTRKHFKDQPLLHHTLGDYLVPYQIFQKITAAWTILADPNDAAREIDRVLRVCILQKRPVYIGVPSDMQAEPIRADQGPWCAPQEPESDPDALAEAVSEIASRLTEARKPIFIPGVEVIRRGLIGDFKRLTEETCVPFVTMLLSKGLMEESHPNFLGLYSGARSRPSVRDAVEKSDCVIVFGERFTDFNTGGFTNKISREAQITINYNSVTIKHHTYNRVYLAALMKALLEKKLPIFPRSALAIASESCVHRAGEFVLGDPQVKLTMTRFFARLADFIPKDAVVIAETGASLFSMAETMLPDGCTFIGQTFYGSIGYTVGATLGALAAVSTHAKADGSKLRPVILCIGDGSFQLTCQEMSTMIRYGFSPLILLINNDGYTIERVIVDNVYNDIQMWKYAKLPTIFGGEDGTVCQTEGELVAYLDKVDFADSKLKFAEIILDKWDCNQLLKDAGRTMAVANKLLPA